MLSYTSQTASSLQIYCGYQRSVLSWVECVRHGSTRTTRTFRSRRQSSRFFFCWKAVDMMHLSTRFTKILIKNLTYIKHELCLHGGMVLEKAKMGVGGPSGRGCPNPIVSITSMDGSGHSESQKHQLGECFSQITSVRRASRRTVGRGTKSSLFFASRIFRHCCVRNRACLDSTFPTNPNTTGKDVVARP